VYFYPATIYDAKMEDCVVFDSSAVEIQPDEAVPLLRHSSFPLSHFEMASVHKSNRKTYDSDAFGVSGCQDSSGFSGINPSLDMDAELCNCRTLGRGSFCCISIMLTCYSNIGTLL